MEIWLTRIALSWLDGSILLLAALLSVGPYALTLTGAGLLANWPQHKHRTTGTVSRAPQSPRFTLR